jgi:hypothetical protein
LDSDCRVGPSDQKMRQQHEYLTWSYNGLNAPPNAIASERWDSASAPYAPTPGNPGHQPQQLGVPDTRTLAWLFEIHLTQGGKVGALAALRAVTETAKRVLGPDALAGSDTGAHPGRGGEDEGAQHAAAVDLTKRMYAVEAWLASEEATRAKLAAAADAERAKVAAGQRSAADAQRRAAEKRQRRAEDARRRGEAEATSARRLAAAEAQAAAAKRVAAANARRCAELEAASAYRPPPNQ